MEQFKLDFGNSEPQKPLKIPETLEVPETQEDNFVSPTSIDERVKVARAIRDKINGGGIASPKELKFLSEERERQAKEDSDDLERTYRVRL